MSERIFKPGAATSRTAVTAASARVAIGALHNGATVCLLNDGDLKVRVEFGDSSVVASSTSMAMLPNSVEVFEVAESITHIAAIAEDTGNAIEVTPGDGA